MRPLGGIDLVLAQDEGQVCRPTLLLRNEREHMSAARLLGGA
jgi:hypothetical protein